MSSPRVTKISSQGKVLWERGREVFRGSLRGLAMGPDGDLFVSEYGADGKTGTRLWKLTGDLEPVKSFGHSGSVWLELEGRQYASTENIHVDRQGNIYWIAQPRGVVKVKPDGTLARDFKTKTPGVLNVDGPPSYSLWSPNRKLDRIADMAVTADGAFLLLDAEGGRVVHIDSAGRYKGEFGGTGYGPGQMRSPAALCLAEPDTLYVVDRGNSRIYRVPVSSIR